MYISTNLDEERKEKKFKTENYKVQIDNFAESQVTVTESGLKHI